MIGIYKITSPSGKVYIGQSKNILRRWNEYKYPNKKTKIERSIKKYGIEKHIFEVVEECDIEMLNERERYWQDNYNVLDRNVGLNLVLTKTEFKNKEFSEETKLKHINYGKKIKFTKDWYEKRLECNCKIIIDTNTGVYYKNAKELSELYKINLSTLRGWLNTTKINKTPFRYALYNKIQNKY